MGPWDRMGRDEEEGAQVMQDSRATEDVMYYIWALVNKQSVHPVILCSLLVHNHFI